MIIIIESKRSSSSSSSINFKRPQTFNLSILNQKPNLNEIFRILPTFRSNMPSAYHNYLYNFSGDLYRSHHYHEDVISRHRQINNWTKQQQQQQQQQQLQQQQQQQQQRQQIQHPSVSSPMMENSNFDVEKSLNPSQFGDFSLPSYSAVPGISPTPITMTATTSSSRLAESQDFQIMPNTTNTVTSHSPLCHSIHFHPSDLRHHHYSYHNNADFVENPVQSMQLPPPSLLPQTSSSISHSSNNSSMRRIFNKMTRTVAKHFLEDERDRKYYADMYSCMPPPFFILTITLVELIFFAYYAIVNQVEVTTSGPIPADSIFIYRPDRKNEVWRFFLYMVLHAGWLHLIFNLLVQLLVGLPLEMVHGSVRIGVVYMAGVLAGSLATSVFDPNCFLVGASGGVFLIASVDVSIAIYHRYATPDLQQGSISYVAHLAGALAGLTIGLLVLKNFEQKLHEQLLWWMALGVYTACIVLALLFNILN
ncbi:Rhomboid- protein 3 [Dermatophagoides farinae]|uniref:Rhomboid- protein 3 n=1 Tax=Dermatophagoides farinae TaxID=6954 RepID=A0A922KYA2_DERFA|nr:Rhomboid- protein 3 [Dermatophagoides farinae]